MNTQTPASASFRNARRAFTLLEILVVLAIIGMLVGLAVTNVGKMLERSRVDSTKLFVTTSLKTALATYRLDNGDYPATADGLQALITAPASATNWRGPYIDVTGGILPLDPWQHSYQYAWPGTHVSSGSAQAGMAGGSGSAAVSTNSMPDIWSLGPDGLDGTPDDIGNW